MLANRALSAGGTTTKTTTTNDNNNDSQACTVANEFHLHEVLSLLPNLQHGMDVNPKFTAGPTGVEYTNNLEVFDLLGVEIVHGWLLDPQDIETVSVVQSKTYNELIETVIHGSEAREAMQKLEDRLRDLERNDIEKISAGERNNATTPNQSQPTEISEKEALIASQLQQIVDAKDKLSELLFQISQSEVVNAFLTLSGHQLTYHGLEQLHAHVGEGDLCVFFRNNHFATLTKHNAVLYLLATDLGYANTPEIVWEKLDNIDGDTEYCNEFFEKPTPRTELKPGPGPTIAPELLLAHRSQAESDYQLALAMSKGDGIADTQQIDDNSQRVDDEECNFIEAAKELSLKTYQQERLDTHDKSANTPGKSIERIDLDKEASMAYYQQRITEQEQSEHESEQLARQLQELEYARPVATNVRRQEAGTTAITRPASKRNGPASSISCSVS